MKIKINRHFKAILAISILVIIPTIILITPKPIITRRWTNNLPSSHHTTDIINATMGFEERKNLYLSDSNQSTGFYAQASRVYSNTSVIEASFTSSINKITNREDTADFRMAMLLRIM